MPQRGYNLLVPTASKTIHVKVLLFGRLKEIAGRSEDAVDLPEGMSIECLFAQFAARYPELARYRGSVVASRNQEFAAWTTSLQSGDEVAFLPPVSGG
jgi:molybdopterin converting factor subunit 1